MINNKLSLGFFPTPIQELKQLSKTFSDHTIYIKRDDHTGLASGGNKTRKLEYLIKQAIDNGCNTVITAGAQQSNHCRQTAAACATAGLECHLLLGGEKPDNYEGNLLLSSLLGAHINFTGDHRKGEDIETVRSELEKHGKRCYAIPYGGSNFIGALGFVNAIKELKTQMMAMALEIDYICFASSSGGMQAGLVLGKALYELESHLLAISIDKEGNDGITLEDHVLGIVNEGLEKLHIATTINTSDIILNKDYDSEGYGKVTNNEVQAIHELARTEGILLDPVYTGRAFYGMLDLLRKKKIPSGSKVLFWHTGGFPAIFKYAEELNRN